MTSPAAASGGGEFRLDLEIANEAVSALRGVHEQLVTLRGDATRLARTPRTATDLISVEAFDLLSVKADGVPGSFGFAIDGAIDHVRLLIDQMNADIVRQREIDEATAQEISSRA